MNPAGIGAEELASHGQPFTLTVTVPPLAVTFLAASEATPAEGGLITRA